MAIKLNNAELERLRGVRHEVFVLYVRLRERMDYATGLVGQRHGCGVSWQGLREDLYVEPHKGYESGSPSKDALRRMGAALVRLGLLLNLSVGKRLIFKCVLADADYSAKNKAATKPPYPDTIEADTLKTSEHAGLNGEAATEAAIPQTAKAATHPVSGKTNNNSTRARGSAFQSPIDDSFQVSAALEMFVRLKLQPDPPDVELNRLLFIEHFSGLIDETTKKPFVADEKGKEKLFRKWLLRAKLIQQRDEQKRNISPGNKVHENSRSLSVFEEIEKANSGARDSEINSIIEGEHASE